MVNRVATPTKFSSYLASGVIPIFSDCLRDFSAISSNMNYALKLERDYSIDDMIAFISKSIDKCEIKKEYRSMFDNYYSVDKHIINIHNKFMKLSI